jgi:hypothetical protein
LCSQTPIAPTPPRKTTSFNRGVRVYIMDRGTIIVEGPPTILAEPAITKHLSV